MLQTLYFYKYKSVWLSFLQIEKITFKNYYTAYVTVRLLRRKAEKEGSAKWCTALTDLTLMDNPHTEGGSQNYFSIHRRQVGQNLVFPSLTGLWHNRTFQMKIRHNIWRVQAFKMCVIYNISDLEVQQQSLTGAVQCLHENELTPSLYKLCAVIN